jgi:hypothetical protein
VRGQRRYLYDYFLDNISFDSLRVHYLAVWKLGWVGDASLVCLLSFNPFGIKLDFIS